MQNSPEAIAECTSANYQGVVSVMAADASREQRRSWVARWQRINTYVPGVYAVQVVGELPEWVVAEMAEKGIK